MRLRVVLPSAPNLPWKICEDGPPNHAPAAGDFPGLDLCKERKDGAPAIWLERESVRRRMGGSRESRFLASLGMTIVFGSHSGVTSAAFCRRVSRRRFFASRSSVISLTNAMSLSGSCSVAARAHNSSHRSVLSCIGMPPFPPVHRLSPDGAGSKRQRALG
jgi:hypothetical protein